MRQDEAMAAVFEVILRRLSTRAFNALVRWGIRDATSLLRVTENQLMRTPGVSISTAREIAAAQQALRAVCATSAWPPDLVVAATQEDRVGRERSTPAPDAFGESASTGDDRTALDQAGPPPPMVGDEAVPVGNRDERDSVAECAPVHQQVRPRRQAPRRLVGQVATAPKVEPGEPAEWSVLRRPLRDLLWTLGGQEEALYRRGDSVRLGVLDLDQSDRECLRAITLTDDDTLADLASMAIGLICDARISDAGFERIVRSLGGLLGSNDIYLTLADDQVSDCPIIGPSEVVSLCSLRLDVFTVSPLLLRALRMLGVATWGELGDLSERDVLGRLGLTATSFTLVRSIWHLHTMVRGISARIAGGLPEDAYTTFERLVYSFVRLGAKTQRDCMILQGRLGTLGGRKWTLDELGAVLKLTRERVRQVAKKHFEKLLRPVALDTLERYWLGVATALTAAGGVLDASELSLALTSLFSWKDAPVGNASASLAALWPGAEVLWDPPVRVILPTHPCLTCDRAPGMLTAEVALADGRLDVSDVATRLRDRCVRYCEAALSGVPFFSKACVLYLAKERTRLNVDGAALYDDRAWAVRYGRRSALVEAVMLEQKRPMHFSEVHERISRMRPDEETLSERNIHAYLGASPTVLLWDRGTYVHRNHVAIPTELIRKVVSDIGRRLGTGVPFLSVSGVFADYREELLQSGIPSASALYSCLREVGAAELSLPEYPYVRLPGSDDERLPVPLVIEQFVLETGIATWDEIRSYLTDVLCLSESLASLHFGNTPNLIHLNKGTYTHVSHLRFCREDLSAVAAHVDAILTQVPNVSARRIFDDKRVACKLLGIDNTRMLHSVLDAFYGDRFVFRFPRIARRDHADPLGTMSGDVKRYLQGKPGPCGFAELQEHFVEGLGYGQATVWSIRFDKDVVRYSSGTVVHLDALAWSDEKQAMLESSARAHYQERLKAGDVFGLVSWLGEFAELPDLPPRLWWTKTLLAEMLVRRGCFRIIGPERDAFVPVPNEHGIEDLGGLVRTILQRKYEGAADLTAFEADMQEAGVLCRRLTEFMLGTNSGVVISGQVVRLEKLSPNVQRA